MQPAQMSQMRMPAASSSWSSLFVMSLALMQALIGLGALAKGAWRTVAIWGGIALSAIFWAVGQNFGTFYSGIATDPNSGPLIVLLGLAVLAAAEELGRVPQTRSRGILSRLELLLT